jgi:hypothetical protein
MRRVLIAGVSALAAVTAASQARASIVDVTYTGQVVWSNDLRPDNANLFGGGSLLGDAFTAHFVLDTSVGALVTDSTDHYLQGGSSPPGGFGIGPSPITSATLTVNGHALALGVDFDSWEQIAKDQSHLGDAASGTAGGVFMSINLFAMPTLAPPLGAGFTFDTPYSGTASVTGNFVSYSQDLSQVVDFFNLSGDTVDIVVRDTQPGVPEPSTWALMLTGFAAAGAMVRRRRRAATA